MPPPTTRGTLGPPHMSNNKRRPREVETELPHGVGTLGWTTATPMTASLSPVQTSVAVFQAEYRNHRQGQVSNQTAERPVPHPPARPPTASATPQEHALRGTREPKSPSRVTMFERSGHRVCVAGIGVEQQRITQPHADRQPCIRGRTGILAPPRHVSQCAERVHETRLELAGTRRAVPDGAPSAEP